MTNAELIKELRGPSMDGLGYASELARKAADALVGLEAKLANAERRAEDAETRNDFLLSEIDEIIKRERQKS